MNLFILSGITWFSIVSTLLLILIPCLALIYLIKFIFEKFRNQKSNFGLKFFLWSIFISLTISITVFILIISGTLNFLFE